MSDAPQRQPQAGANTAAPAQEKRAPDVRIDRLVLDIPGLDPADARTLARRIAEGLAQTGGAADRPALSVTLADPATAPDQLAAQIAAALRERL